MKFIAWVFSFICVLVLSSSMSLTRTSATVGSEAPDFTVFNRTCSVRPADLNGKYVIVNFWSVTDPISRQRNIRLSAEAKESGSEFIGVCIDEDRTLMQEVVAQDGLDPKTQFMASDTRRGDPAGSYETHTGLRAFEINPFGNIETIWEGV